MGGSCVPTSQRRKRPKLILRWLASQPLCFVAALGQPQNAILGERASVLGRLQYLEHTQVEYRHSLEGLPDEPSALEAAVARALARDDHSAADGLYARWLLAGGSDALVWRLPAADGERVAAAATALAVQVQRPAPGANLTRATAPIQLHW